MKRYSVAIYLVTYIFFFVKFLSDDLFYCIEFDNYLENFLQRDFVLCFKFVKISSNKKNTR